MPLCFLTWQKYYWYLSQGRNSIKKKVSQISGIFCKGLLVC